MRILIYGAGVIGSLYAVLFSKNKNTDVSVYARGKRLEELRENGLRYLDKGTVKVADVRIIDAVKNDDIYDHIFLTVREDQLYKALEELRGNISQNVVTMVNSLDDYKKWEDICGKGRIKRNMKNNEGKLSPKKFYMFTSISQRLIAVGLAITFKSEFGDRFMYRHSMKAPDEMKELHRKFYGYIKDLSKKA